MKEWQTQRVKLADLRPASYNPRTISTEALSGLSSSMERFGLVQLIVWNKRTKNVVGGHQRLKVLSEKGVVETDVVVVDLDEQEEVALNITLNNPTIQGDFTAEASGLLKSLENQLGYAFEELKLNDLQDSLSGMIAENKSGNPDAEPQIDRAAEMNRKWQVLTGDLWRIGEHYLACGDCADPAVIDRVMRGEKVEAVITDPPYGQSFNINYTRFSGGIANSANFGAGIIGDDKEFDPTRWLNYKTVILFGANFFARFLPVGTWLVWDKRYKGQDKILSDGEIAWLNRGIGVYIFSHGWNGFMRESERGRTLHPTQKPVALFEWCIGFSENSPTVLDPYAGSGPCLAACQNLGRKGRAIEISPDYCAIILERMVMAFPKLKIERIQTATKGT
jgi:DNA modification methylase